ncbi:MAG: hypothetical protein H0V25_01415 [Solirubrobacterales bacterium]|nr:hypothetical protein [Solirubrobacterales bacterium]
MNRIVLFSDRSRPEQAVAAGVIPAIVGALAGILLGASATAYWVIGILAAIGAFVAGFEHLRSGEAAKRGLVAGVVYGCALLLAHAIVGSAEKVSLGEFPPFLIVITGLVGMVLTAPGSLIAQRRRD